MGKSQETFSKKEKEKKRIKKRKEKQEKREERKANSNKGGSWEDMVAYVDENGQIVDTPPDPSKRKKVKASSIELGVPKKEETPLDTKRMGKISYFDTDKGYGFVIEKETQEKFFVHVSGLMDRVSENDKVSFELEQGQKGLNAVKVKKQS